METTCIKKTVGNKVHQLLTDWTVYILAFTTFKLLEMVLIFSKWTDKFTKFFLLWGLVVLLTNILKKGLDFHSKEVKLLILFLICNSITILLNYHSRLWANLVIEGRLGIIYLLIFGVSFSADKKIRGEFFYKFAYLITTLTFVVGLASLTIYFIGDKLIYWPLNSTVSVALGMGAGSFYGYLGSSTVAGIVSLISIVSSMSLFNTKDICRIEKIMLGVNITVQVILIAIYHSRGVMLCFGLYMALIVFLWFINEKYYKTKKKSVIGKALALSIAILIISMFSFYCIRSVVLNVSSAVQTLSITIKESLTEKGNISEEIMIEKYLETKEKNVEASIRSDIQNDFSNARIFLWKTNLKTVRENTVFGVGMANVAEHFYKNLDSEQNALSYSRIAPNTHNSYLQVLVTNGITGLIIMCIFILNFLFKAVKFLFCRLSTGSCDMKALMSISIICILLFNGLFEYFILTQQGFVNVVFFYMLSYILARLKDETEFFEDEKEEK